MSLLIEVLSNSALLVKTSQDDGWTQNQAGRMDKEGRQQSEIWSAEAEIQSDII